MDKLGMAVATVTSLASVLTPGLEIGLMNGWEIGRDASKRRVTGAALEITALTVTVRQMG
jgi:hypothetical protein